MTTFIAFDLETTGLDPKNDAIIELAFVRFDETGILERWSTLVNPGFTLPEEVVNITGITDADLVEAPFFSDIREKLLEFLADESPLLGHNVDFDASFLREYGVDLGSRILLDTFHLSKIFFYREKSLNLGSLLESLGSPYTDQHRALGDAEATVELFRICLDTVHKVSSEQKDILSFCTGIAPAHSALRFFLEYVGFMSSSVSLGTIRETILAKRKNTGEMVFLKDEKNTVMWRDILASHDTIVTLEERPEQAKMLDLTTGAFEKNELLLVEAPTGIGKTFAYGIPSLLFSIRTGKQVFVSTHTKTLQDQIFEKDIPNLRLLFTRHDIGDFSVAKIKGRSNYPSLLLLFEYLAADSFEETEVIFLAKVLFWLHTTRFGELDELVFYGPEYGYMDRIRSSDKRVLIPENPYRKEEFLYTARQDAKNANLVIMNHSLLLSEIESVEDAKILPGIKHLVIDEAHNLEAVATDALKRSVSLSVIESALEGIESVLRKQKRTPDMEPFIFPELRAIAESIILSFGMIFDVFGRYLPIGLDTRYNQALIESNFFRGEEVAGARRILDSLHERIHELLSGLYNAPESLYDRLERYTSTIESSLEVIEIIFHEKEKDFIKVVASDRDEIVVSMTPLHVGSKLQE